MHDHWLAHLCDQQGIIISIGLFVWPTRYWHFSIGTFVCMSCPSWLAHLHDQQGIALDIKRGEVAWYYWLTALPWESPQDTLVAFFSPLYVERENTRQNLMLTYWVRNPPLWLDSGSRCLRDSSYDILSPNMVFSRPTNNPWPSFITTLSIRYTCSCEQKQRAGNRSDVIYLLV